MNTANGGPEMTTDELKELIGKVTQGEWAITGQPDKVCAEGYNKQGAAKVIVDVQEKAWIPASEQFANADLIALAPSLARRVIAADKLVEALLLLIGDMQSLDKEDWASATIGLEYITEYEATK